MRRLRLPVFLSAILVLMGGRAGADTSPQASLSQDWSNAGLITTDDNWNGVPGIVGRRGDDLTTGTGVDPRTLLADQTTIDVIANQTDPNALTSGGVAEFDGLANRVVALQASDIADAPFLLLTLNASNLSNVTVSYNLRDIDGSADNAVTPVALQYRVGSTGNFTTIPAGYVADATTGPNLATLVTPVSVLLPGTVNYQPFVQVRIITSNAVGVDEWIGIDDIHISVPSPCFNEIASGLTGVAYSAATWGDYDNDGDLDLLISGDAGGAQITRVYRNSGGPTPTFTDILTGLPGIYDPTVAWIDYDRDGDLDIFMTGQIGAGPGTRIYRNNGGPNPLFTDALVDLPGTGDGAAAWGDYDNDGDPDLLLTGKINQSLPPMSRIYRNNGGPSPTFTDIAAGLVGMWEGACAWADYDKDGDLDIVMAGLTDDFAVPFIYRNDDGTFVDAGEGNSDNEGLSVAWGDHNNDGNLDLLLNGYSIAIWTNRILGDGEHHFVDQHPNYGPAAQFGTSAWGDYDNDGRLDFLSAGYDYWASASRAVLFRGLTTIPFFTDVGAGLPGVGGDFGSRSGCAWGDGDGDGDLDLVMTGYSSSPPFYQARVLRNDCASANTRPQAPSNLSVTINGTRATFHWNAATDAETPSLGLSYNLRVGTSPGAGDIVPPMALASGIRSIPALGNAMQNLFWEIELPSSGQYYWSVQSIDGAYAGSPFAPEQQICFTGYAEIAAGITGTAGGGASWGDYDNDGDLDLLVSGTPDASTFITKVYRNNGGVGPTFTDINAGLPGTIYGSGAWGDCDNDGDLDVLLTGITASGAIAKVFRNTGGTFTDVAAGLTGVYFGGAAWGDIDNDGDLDILTAGFNEATGVAKLYRSSGGANPTYTDVGAGLTGVVYGTATFSDYDLDGDLDILITGLPGAGSSPTATLYRNSGGANPTFTDVGAGLSGVIIGTTEWGDYDNDGDPDLLIAGEDSTQVKIARIYRNSGGANPAFSDVGAGLTGCYAGGAAWGDHDNDGDLDVLLAGNTGSASFAALYESSGGANPTFTEIGEALDPVSYGSAAFGDFDNDHDLDIILTGQPGPPNTTRVYRNACRPLNTPPQPPSNLSVSFNGTRATFSWNAAVDAQTPAAGLSYNLRVGTSPGASDVVAPMAAYPNGVRRIPATGNAFQRTSRTINLTGAGPWFWSVQAIDGAFEGSSFAAEQTTGQVGVAESPAPTTNALWSRGPNPSLRSTTIRFSLKERAPVSIGIYDVTGRQVRSLVDETLDAGYFSRDWDGTNEGGGQASSGLYFVRMSTGAFSQSYRFSFVR